MTQLVDFIEHYGLTKGYHTPTLQTKHVRRFDVLLDRAGCRATSSILEIGCGTGLFLQYLEAKGCEHFAGIDLDGNLESHIHESVRDRFEIADAQAYLATVEAGSLDAIFMFDVFEHFDVDSGHAVLAAARSALSERGRIVLKMPNAASPWGAQYQFGDLTHRVAYAPSSIRQMADTAGYTCLSCFAHEEGSRSRMVTERLLHGFLSRVLTQSPEIWTANFVAVLQPRR